MPIPKYHLKSIISLVSDELKEFKKMGNHFHRECNGIIHGIHFQSSQWNNEAEGKFTINLIVSSQLIYSIWTGKPFPKNPATASWPICARIGMLGSKNTDIWWTLSDKINPNTISNEILKIIKEYAYQFFEQYKSIDDIFLQASMKEKSPVRIPYPDIVRAIILHLKGDISGAKLELDNGKEFMKKQNISTEVYSIIAERLNIPI